MKKILNAILLLTFLIVPVTASLAVEEAAQNETAPTDETLAPEDAEASEKEDVHTKQEDEKVVEEQAETDDAETIKMLNQALPTHTQYCQGKYKKKGINGIEILTVECPNVKDTCNCEVTKNLSDRVSCGGNVKSASKGTQLLDCSSTILRN